MPAGDMLPDDTATEYAIEVNGWLAAADGFGDADFAVFSIDGLGGAEVEGQDIPWSLGDGSRATVDVNRSPLLAFGIRCKTGTVGTAETALRLAQTAWKAQAEDVELHIRIPGFGHVYYVGRTRGLNPVRVFPAGGIFTATVSFLATDPTETIVEDP